MTKRVFSAEESSEYELELLHKGADFTFYRGRQRGKHTPLVTLATVAEQPSAHSARRLEHEYPLAPDFGMLFGRASAAILRA